MLPAMYDHELEEKLRSGGQLVTAGVVVLILCCLGTCVAAMDGAASSDPATAGFETGQSPFLALGLAVGILLIVVGQVRKTNARNAANARYLEQHTSVEVVLDENSPDGPFRGDMKEIEVLDPAVAAAEETQRAHDRRRGNRSLAIGGTIMALTVLGLVWAFPGADDHGSVRRMMERFLGLLGFSLIPFGIGLYFAIRGALLRSK
jgi:hypothetical protein